MISIPMPRNEARRLRVLHDLRVDFSAPIAEIQKLTELASELAQTPIALVSLVGADVQNFISNVGLPGVDGTPREIAFCAHTIMEQKQLVVPDAQRDQRFSENPLVVGGLGVRAYVGSVLDPEPGANVGTLCVIDTVPRDFSAEILRQLDHLSCAITALLRAHRDSLILRERLVAEANQKVALQDLANRDPLTGLLNQSGFRCAVNQFLKQRVGDEVLAIIDVDYFKQVNDRWGHPFGDEYLKIIADSLMSTLGDLAIVGRIGGDEFAALLPSGSRSAQVSIFKDVRLRIQEKLVDLGKTNLGRISVGLCPVAEALERSFEALYQRADVALYASKDRGRNTTSVFSPELDSKYNLRVLRSRFSEGLEAGEIEAFFQPKVDLRNGRIAGFELLARWRDSRRGLLTPDFFEQLLVDQMIAPDLTRHMLSKAIDAQRDLHLLGMRGTRMAVNVTHFDLSDPDFVPDLQSRLSEAGLQWSCLELEVTERAILSDINLEIQRSLENIRIHGGTVALDDFGMGHAGLLHLRDWPIDVLKLDKSFVRDVACNERDEAIVSSIVNLARRLGLSVTAEGIETPEVAMKLYEMGCAQGQGYLYAPALPWEDALGFVTRYAA